MEHVAIALFATNSFNTSTEISPAISWKPWHLDTIKNLTARFSHVTSEHELK